MIASLAVPTTTWYLVLASVLLGIGTVGGGAYTVLTRNAVEITRRTGIKIVITHVADKNLELARIVTGGNAIITDDAFEIVKNPDIDVVIELIGGYTLSKNLVLKAIFSSLNQAASWAINSCAPLLPDVPSPWLAPGNSTN